ncbi:caspase family protein [Streptomyces sp. NBC_00878]|uniref:HD domain-containing protein n=1 Tax=Streptomyces sp. NBC_00878 TaxID=2975854 RepID=UPI002250A052|nr:caspase family protein [Streptomyces sp. NBC_00878]MCX4909834.1 caspase family protein [Streptomyces sp. NBC_00878]
MGESRQALIVAVPQYELSDRFEDLTDTVGRDVELMTAALRSSGYSVELIGVSPHEPALRSRIRSTISRVCATAPGDSTVLIHFTGHGLSVGNADYLVPADAQLTWATSPPQVAIDSLIGLDLAKLLQGCRADTVLLTVDACRDTAGADGPSYGGPTTNFPAWRDRVAVLFGCGPGQTCGSDAESGSHFSRALAEALHADTAPRTVADVITHTVRRTTEFARAAREEQTPTPHYAPSGPDVINDVELCAGRTLQEEWTLAVRDPELWASVQCGDERRAELQQALVRLTQECAKWRGGALAHVPDPWADDNYPVRVLSRGLRPLLAPSQTQGGPLLDAGEFALLAAAPFVREAIYAMGIRSVATIDPLRLDPAMGDAARDPERVDLEHTFAAHALLRRKGRELAGRGRAEDAEAVAAWLVHRHVSGKEELWDTYAPQLLAPLAKVMIGADAAPARLGELTDELVRVCRQTAVAPAQPYQGERERADTRWRLDELVRPDSTAERWRPRELSWLIGVAGLLGGDLRQLPGVLVDNIGITDGLSPAQALQSMRELRWSRDRHSKALDLDLPCPHPAVHAALEALTQWTDDAVQRIRAHTAPAEPAELLTHLPERVTCRKLRPQYDITTRSDAYGMPLMRFALAEDEMRELLMGTHLYGDPALALRELYQNALDACRYREARVRYGELGRKIVRSWEGEIVFRQGVDDEGRPYVECEDNGVGMGHETLRGTFSRAGRRFEQSREYRREQANWRRADPDLRIYPNSRFGVGVFSYFMLADEISIWTRDTDEYGREDPSGGLRVDIASSGSLFRIRKNDEAQARGGTKVRLYLQADGIDVAGELGKHIWRSDFAMRVENEGETVRTWEKKALYYFGDHTRPVPAGKDMWWVEGRGCLLADGVQVDAGDMLGEEERTAYAWLRKDRREPYVYDPDEPNGRRRTDTSPFGCVVDLRENHAPDISTNRTRLLSYDRAWVVDRILESSADFEAPEWITMEWLWAFATWHPEGAVRITERLLAADARITSRLGWDRSTVIEFRKVGVFPLDSGLVALKREYGEPGALSSLSSREESLLAWRVGALRSVGIEIGVRMRELAVPETVAGYPGPQAWEARLGRDQARAFDAVRRAALEDRSDEILTLGDLWRRLRRYAIAGLEMPAVTGFDAAHAMTLDATDCVLLMGPRRYFGALLDPDFGREEVDVLSVLSRFSTQHGLPIGEALGRARRFAAAGFPLTIPETVAEPPETQVATREELAVLAWHFRFVQSGEPPRGRVPSVEDYEEVLRRYAWLGVTPVALPEHVEETGPKVSPPRSRYFSPTEEAREEFQRSLGMSWFDDISELSLRQLARASGMLSLPVDRVVARYEGVLTAQSVRIPDYGDLADRVFSRLDSDLLGAAVPGYSRAGGGAACPAPLLETAYAVRKVQETAEQVAESLRGLAADGLVDPGAPALVERWRDISQSDWDLLPAPDHRGRGLYRYPKVGASMVVDGEIHGPYALLAAAHAGMPLGSVIARLLAVGPLVGLAASGPALPASLAEVRPTTADIEACCVPDSGTPDWFTDSVPVRLVHHALSTSGTLGESMAVLSRYAPLGGPWREPADEGQGRSGHGDGFADWREHRPTQHDKALFDADLVGARPAGRALFDADLVGARPAGPLELLRVAARFGWRIDHAWDRLAVYRPFGLELLVERPEFDAVPTWQDLILLTEHYTGSAPALGGQVTAERIAVTARELEQPTRWVHDRLALYASLFGLALPAECPAEPAPTPIPRPYRDHTE